MKVIAIALTLFLSSSLVAQAECPPLFVGTGVHFPFPPVVIKTTVTEDAKVPGICPAGWCTFDFTVEVDVFSTAPGQTFNLCLNPPICIPFPIPHDPLKPDFTQYMNTSYDMGVQCGSSQVLDLWWNAPLGQIRIVAIVMTCGGC